MTGRIRLRVLILATAASALLTGCVSLPDHSSVHSAREEGAHRAPSLVKSAPPGPQPGDPPQSIVAGYLRAMLAFPSNPALVREFLTPEAAQDWRPQTQTRIYQDPEISLVGPEDHERVRVFVNLLGALDARGSWSSTVAPRSRLPLQVVKSVDGQYRIADPVGGMLINAEHFARYYHQYSLYYYDLPTGFLAPDPVYLQVGAPSATATALIHDLLLGPTTKTRGAVHSIAPAATRLTRPVTVSSSGLATVPLSANISALNADQFIHLAQQLAWTLRQDRVGVNHIGISVGGQVRPVQGYGSVFSVGDFSDPTERPASHTIYALAKTGRLYSVQQPNNAAVPVTGPISTVDIDARSVAVDPSGATAALVSGDGTRVVAGGVTPAQSEFPAKTWYRGGSDLLRPSYDGSGLLWLVEGNHRHAIIRVATSTSTKLVQAPSFTGTDIRDFALSPDGVRFAAVIGRGEHSELVVALVKRDTTSPTDVSLLGRTPIVNSAFPLSDIHGLAWVDDTHVEVLAQDLGNDSQPYSVAVDGSRVEPLGGLPLPPSPVSLAAGVGGVPTIVGDAQGELYYQKAEAQWAPVGAGHRLFAPAYPG
jgi:lipoprotein LpqB-like beta-propeller protein/sporulation and spore germination protein